MNTLPEDTELYEDETINAVVPCGWDLLARPCKFYVITNFRVFTLADNLCTEVPFQRRAAVSLQ